MDRRQALKKLGVGGAVAVVGPVVLQSYAVAATASDLLAAVNAQITSTWLSGTATLSQDKKTLTFNPVNPVSGSVAAYAYLFLSPGFSNSASGGGIPADITQDDGKALNGFTLEVQITWTDVVSVRATYEFTFTPGAGNNFTWSGSVLPPGPTNIS